MPDDPPMLTVAGISKSYRDVAVFSDVELAVPGGGTCAVVGPNGAGKSTLLECLAGATRIDEGSLFLRGEVSDTSSSAHWTAVFGILDDFTWLPDLTVADHLMLMAPTPDVAVVNSALAAFEISPLRDRLPESLSSGQRQRAALATMHVGPWTVLLLDEPDRHLDTAGVATLAAELTAAVASGERCVLVATHSSELLSQLDCEVVDLSAEAAA